MSKDIILTSAKQVNRFRKIISRSGIPLKSAITDIQPRPTDRGFVESMYQHIEDVGSVTVSLSDAIDSSSVYGYVNHLLPINTKAGFVSGSVVVRDKADFNAMVSAFNAKFGHGKDRWTVVGRVRNKLDKGMTHLPVMIRVAESVYDESVIKQFKTDDIQS